MTLVDQAKQALRRQMRARLAGLDPARGHDLAAVALAGIDFSPYATIAGVWAMPHEIDLAPLWQALHARGHQIVLPETPPKGQALVFRRWSPQAAMRPGRYGTFYPEGDLLDPDLIFVPMLAFDCEGHRLGQGGGYYDRTLAHYAGVEAIGFGHADQQIDAVPHGAHDCALRRIVTDRGVIAAIDKSGGLPQI